MRKIITLAIIIAITPHICTRAFGSAATIDYCSLAGVTPGNSCTSSTAPGTVTVATTCISASAGCKYWSCPRTQNCTCSPNGCTSTGGGTTITDCSGTTCNPTWGSIDTTTHTQQGQSRKPDTSNNCACINSTSGIAGGIIYRCIAGYYDTSTSAAVLEGTKPTCEQCPSWGNNDVAGQSTTGITASPSNRGITSCYIPYNTDITDDTGLYVFSPQTVMQKLKAGCHYIK
ncbi:MAG: hypothetical protein NC311_06060 [Muribaculaceae bacterium]|nr:hypothetical protein [Muribaculaceae bacterium]